MIGRLDSDRIFSSFVSRLRFAFLTDILLLQHLHCSSAFHSCKRCNVDSSLVSVMVFSVALIDVSLI